jgi:hypothetical protein
MPVDRRRYHFFGSSYAPAASGIRKRDNPRCRRLNITVLRVRRKIFVCLASI